MKKIIFLLLSLVIVGIFIFAVWLWYYNPLPSDESMIEHFYEHRAEFEELVRNYRAFVPYSARTPPKRCEIPPCEWDSNIEMWSLKRKAGVYDIATTGFDGAVWSDDPYSVNTTRRIDDMIRNRNIRLSLLKHKYSGIVIWPNKRHQPEEHLPSEEKPESFLRQPENDGSEGFSIHYLSISKTWFHIPGDAMIKNGQLWWPANLNGTFSRSQVFDSLNNYPPGWRRAECVYRQFETHWFLRMCRRAI